MKPTYFCPVCGVIVTYTEDVPPMNNGSYGIYSTQCPRGHEVSFQRKGIVGDQIKDEEFIWTPGRKWL